MTMQQRRNEANAPSSPISKREINKFIRKRFGQKQILRSSGFATGHRKPSGKAFRQKAQSAMEYLMTYGWAILIIAIVLVAFFSLNLFNPYTFSPKASPGSCQILRPNGPGSNIFVSAVGPTCTTNEIPQYVGLFNPAHVSNISISTNYFPIGSASISEFAWINENANMLPYPQIFGYGTDAQINTYSVSSTVYNPRMCTATTCFVDSRTFSAGQWVMIGFTYNVNTGNIVSYLNGVGGIPQSGSTQDLTGPAFIGRQGGYQFGGLLSNIQVYNTSLSSSAVNTLYTEGIGGTPIDLQHLVGWWPLNGNSNDYSGNGNNGVPTSVIFTSSWENGYSSP